jgi:two-component system response regulator RegA
MNLLLVDDDVTFTEVLARALTRRGYNVLIAHDIAEAERLLADFHPGFAVLDLRMPGDSGLLLIPKLLDINRQIRIVILTGYASIATAIEAIKLGATHYLTKPADADEIVAAFDYKGGSNKTAIPEKPLPLERREWEYIQKILVECNGNISAAARKLGLHRRTLQRKLQKRPSGLE